MDDHSDSEVQRAGNMNAKASAVNIFPFISLYCPGEAWAWKKKNQLVYLGLFSLCDDPLTLKGLMPVSSHYYYGSYY